MQCIICKTLKPNEQHDVKAADVDFIYVLKGTLIVKHHCSKTGNVAEEVTTGKYIDHLYWKQGELLTKVITKLHAKEETELIVIPAFNYNSVTEVYT